MGNTFNLLNITNYPEFSLDHINSEFKNIVNNNNKNLVEIVNSAFINKSNITSSTITLDDINTPELLPIEILSLQTNNFTTLGTTPLFNSAFTPERIKIYNSCKISEDYDIIYNDFSNYGLYIDGSVNPFKTSKLKLNNHTRFNKQSNKYFNYVQPYQHFSSTPSEGINCYSFALNPIEYQPSGICNFSKFEDKELEFEFNTKLDKKIKNSYIYIYATNYNLLKISNGRSNLLYL